MNSTSSSSSSYQFPPSFHILIYTVYNLIFLFALLGNFLVIFVVFRSPRMHTATNYLIANLALGDLLMAALCVPFSYIPILLQYWPFGSLLCHVVAPAQAICVFVSAYTLVALALERYVAILYPLRPRMRGVGPVVGVVWGVAALTALPVGIFTKLEEGGEEGGSGRPLCEEVTGNFEFCLLRTRTLVVFQSWPTPQLHLSYSLTLMALQYLLPVIVLIFTYTRIALAVWGRNRPFRALERTVQRNARILKTKRKMIKMMLTVVVVYSVSWCPLNFVIILWSLYPTHPSLYTPSTPYFYFLFHLLAMSHTVANPVIYCWMNERFREEFSKVLGCGQQQQQGRRQHQPLETLFNRLSRSRSGSRRRIDESFV